MHPSASIILRGRCLNHVWWEGPLCTKCKYYPKRTMLKSRWYWEGPSPKYKYYPKRTMLNRMTSTCAPSRVPHPKRTMLKRMLSTKQDPMHYTSHDVWEGNIHCAPSASIILRGRCLNHVCERVQCTPSASIILRGRCLNHVMRGSTVYQGQVLS